MDLYINQIIILVFQVLESLVIQNEMENDGPNGAWKGEIVVFKKIAFQSNDSRVCTNDSKCEKVDLICTSGCTGSKFVSKIVVDTAGAEDGGMETPTRCMIGKSCTIVPSK